jgi:hypothetical protein
LKREDVWGIEFDWWATDQDGHIAIFCSAGYGPIPLAALEDPRATADADVAALLIDGLPSRGRWRAEGRGPGECREWVQLAERGLYVFDWAPYHGPYDRVVVPEVALTRSGLPDVIASARALLMLPSICFTHTHAVMETELPVVSS